MWALDKDTLVIVCDALKRFTYERGVEVRSHMIGMQGISKLTHSFVTDRIAQKVQLGDSL